jgi:hypothetical protein
MLVSRYRIEVKEEPQFAAETFEERKERLLKPWVGLTLTYELSTANVLSVVSALMKLTSNFVGQEECLSCSKDARRGIAGHVGNPWRIRYLSESSPLPSKNRRMFSWLPRVLAWHWYDCDIKR